MLFPEKGDNGTALLAFSWKIFGGSTF